jgi:hypothetical protein
MSICVMGMGYSNKFMHEIFHIHEFEVTDLDYGELELRSASLDHPIGKLAF